MTKLYIAALVILLFVAFWSYRKYRNRIKSRRYSMSVMRMLAGVAMMIQERTSSGYKDGRVRYKLSQIESSENVDEQHLIYREEKIIVAYAIILISLVFAIVGAYQNGEAKVLKSIERNENGGGVKNYSLDVSFEESPLEKLEISVGEEKPDEKEAERIFNEKQDEIINRMLAGNSRNRVEKNLDFSQVSLGNISIIWEVEDPEIISYDGKIQSTVPKEGVETQIYANLALGEYSRKVAVDLTVFPTNGMKDIQGYIQNYVDDSDKKEERIELPEYIQGEKVTFWEQREEGHRLFFPMGCFLALAYYFFRDRSLDGELKKRKDQLQTDYPELVCKMLLLTSAGLSVRGTFKKIYDEAGEKKKERYLYKEIKLMLMKLERGTSEMTAYEEFGGRCELHSYVRLMNIITQNLKRGSSELANALEEELHSAFYERRTNALKAGEVLSTKLLVPMILLLIVGMTIIAFPAFMSFAVM